MTHFARHVAFATSLSLFAVSASPPVLAQPKAPAAAPKKGPLRDQLTGEARARFERASQVFKSGTNYSAAMALFTEAYDLSKNPRVLFNVAICERHLNLYARAVMTLRRGLAEGEGKIPADEVVEMNKLIKGLEDFVSNVELVVSEPGAKITVNNPAGGAPIELGQSPLAGTLPVEVGERSFVAQKPGFSDATATIMVKKKETTKVTLKLEPLVKKSQVTVIVDGAPNAVVLVDDVEMGPAPFKGELAIGKHRLAVRAQGYKETSQTIDVPEGRPFEARIAPAVDANEGMLVITTDPTGGNIEIDGKSVGATRWEGAVKAGRHFIEVKKSGYVTSRHEVFVASEEQRDVSARLTAEKDTSWIPWTIGTILVVGGAAAVAAFAFRPDDKQPVLGTLDPGTARTLNLGRW